MIWWRKSTEAFPFTGPIVYNQQKVDDATARIIYGNRMITDVTGNPEQVMRQTMWAFENYLLANKNTEKPYCTSR